MPAQASPAEQRGKLVDNLMLFARVLRAAGLPVGPGKVIVDVSVALRDVAAVVELAMKDGKAKLFDLKSGAYFREVPLAKAFKGARWFDKAGNPVLTGAIRVSPDGRLAHSDVPAGFPGSSSAPVRINVEGGSFSVEEIGPAVGGIEFYFGHPNSKYAAVWGGYSAKIKGHPEMKGRGTIVYKANDFAKPLGVVPDARPLCGGPRAGTFWALYPSGELALHDDSGKKEKSWFPFSPGFQVDQVSVAPNESSFMLRSSGSSTWTWIRWVRP